MRPLLITTLALLPLAAAAQDAAEGTFEAPIIGADGAEIGQFAMVPTASGLAHVTITASGIPEGVHGVHLHETGVCEGDFSSAGDHLAGDMQHGVLVEGGPHPGDLPNAHVQGDGEMAVEYFTDRIDADGNQITDADGTAFIIHSGADDYESQPSGDAGDRIGCAVIAPPES